MVQEQKASADVLINLQAQHVSSGKKAVSLFEMQLSDAQTMTVDLKAQLHQAKAELKIAQETSIITEQTISSTLHARVKDLEKVVKDLEQQNDELSTRSVDILLRYQQGNLVSFFPIVCACLPIMDTFLQIDFEKVFVAYIMKQTRDIHEQSDVAKDNELRMASIFWLLLVTILHISWQRETMIQALQAKVADFETTIACMIKEKENLKQVGPSVTRPVVNLNRWLSASPVG